MDNKEIVYLILQDKYLRLAFNKEDYTEEEVILNSSSIFFNDWSYLNIDDKIKYINEAISKKENLKSMFDFSDEKESSIPKL